MSMEIVLALLLVGVTQTAFTIGAERKYSSEVSS